MKKPLVFMLGQSGAGISSALRALQDIGFFIIDNLPLHLTPNVLQKIDDDGSQGPEVGFAFGVHSALNPAENQLRSLCDDLSSQYTVDVVFLKTATPILERRFSLTRRPHPFLLRASSLQESIALEQTQLRAVQEQAHHTIDTSALSLTTLAQLIQSRYIAWRQTERFATKMLLLLSSFGFKHVFSHPSDLVFDARFLRNPFFEPQLKDKNGLHADVAKYVKEDARYAVFMDKILSFLGTTLPYYQSEGRTYLRLAVGCTGGIHRSVTVVEDLARHFQNTDMYPQLLVHHLHTNLQKETLS